MRRENGREEVEGIRLLKRRGRGYEVVEWREREDALRMERKRGGEEGEISHGNGMRREAEERNARRIILDAIDANVFLCGRSSKRERLLNLVSSLFFIYPPGCGCRWGGLGGIEVVVWH